MNENELKAFELSDEQLKQVSGGFKGDLRGQICPNYDDCEGSFVLQCPFTYCPYGYK